MQAWMPLLQALYGVRRKPTPSDTNTTAVAQCGNIDAKSEKSYRFHALVFQIFFDIPPTSVSVAAAHRATHLRHAAPGGPTQVVPGCPGRCSKSRP